MDFIFIIIILLVLTLITKSTKQKKRDKTKETSSQTADFPDFSYMPYKKKNLLTNTEYQFYKTLKIICDKKQLLICPKVRLEDFINVTTQDEKMKYRGYIKSRHIDFILTDDNLHILCGIELDDSSHNTLKAAKTDDFKNQLFSTIGVPLIRIPVGTDYTAPIITALKKSNII